MKKTSLLILAIAAALTLSACGSAQKDEPQAGTEPTQSAAPAEAPHSHARGDGSIDEIQGVGLTVVPADIKAGQQSTVQFTLTRFDEPIMDYVISHEFPVHVVAVREDLGEYIHVHPTMGKNGEWQLPMTFPTAGVYRLVADFIVTEGSDDVNYVLGTDITVAGPAAPAFTLAAPTDKNSVDGYDVTVSGAVSATSHSMLMFTILKDGMPVTLEPWLGTGAHMVAIRQGDLAYAHMHPSGHDHGSTASTDEMESSMGQSMGAMPGMVHFDAEFPAGAGTYRLFLQFKADGVVHTVPFTAEVN